MIDFSYISELSGGDSEFELQMMNIYTDETPGDLLVLTEQYHKGQYEDLVLSLHALKSKLSIIGLVDLFQSADILEKKYKSPIKQPEINIQMEQFISDLKSSVEEVKQEINKRQSV